MRARTPWLVGLLALVAGGILCLSVFKVHTLRLTSSLFSQAGLNSHALKLDKRASELEVERKARSAFGEDVVWVEIHQQDAPYFFSACLDLVDTDESLSAISLPGYKFKACVPSRLRSWVLKQMELRRSNITFPERFPFQADWRKRT